MPSVTIDAEYLDQAVDKYFDELLSEKNMADVESAISKYHADEIDRKKRFIKERDAQISLKETQLKNLMDALMNGDFKDNYEFCNNEMTKLRNEIEVLKHTKEPIVNTKKIRSWLEGIKNAKDTPKTLIDRIEVNDDEVTIHSVFSNIGCGGTDDIFPKLLWGKKI